MAQEKTSLHIVIVGAGLCGLAIAIPLADQGHSVTVLETREGLSEVGAGIQVPPNATRILYAWGLQDEIERVANPSTTLHIKRYASGDLLGELSPGVEKSGLPTWLIYRPELQKILYQRALVAGASVLFGATVTEIDSSSSRIHSSDGRVLTADLVLIADGIGSKNRKFVLDDADVQPKVLNNAYRLLIPAAVMDKYPETARLMSTNTRQLWAGPGRNVVAYPIARGKFYNVILEHPGQSAPGVWNKPGDLNNMRTDFKDFEPTIQALIALAEGCVDWTIARLPPLPRWSSVSGNILLVGDAAHATTPQLAQGAAMAIEDAAVLAECIARLRDKKDISIATASFENIRKDRVERIQQVSWENSFLFNIHDGEEQEARDKRWRDRLERPQQQPSQASDPTSSFIDWLTSYDATLEASKFLRNKL